MAQGHDESSASAICTASLQEAGEPIFEAAEFRQLQGVTGAVRTEMWNGREHLVVPVVALMEGVIHAINAQTPEFVSAAALSKKTGDWNGHPLVLGHPVRDGKQISAHEAAILDQHAFGHVRAAHMKDSRLGVEALIDPSRLEQLGQSQLLNDLRAGKAIEVSVGAFVTTNGKSGEYRGKPYKSEWVDIMPDHLAFLPNGRGACSLEMGCGAHRMAQEKAMSEELSKKPLDAFRAAIGARNSATDLATIQAMHDYATKLGAKCDAQNTRLLASRDCPACEGTGNKDGNPCDVCEGTGELKTAAEGGNMADLKTAASVKELAEKIKSSFGKYTLEDALKDNDLTPEEVTELKELAKPAPKSEKFNFDKLKGAEAQPPCGCGGDNKMTPEQKATVISTLIACPYSDFADGDQPVLEQYSDERLEALRAAADGRKTAAEELKAAAELKTAEEPKPMTEADFMKLAPSSLRSLIERQQKQDAEDKAELVAALKTAQDEFTEAEMVAMPLDHLKRLSRVAKVAETPASYEGRGVPRQLMKAEDDVYANPPDPYAEALKLRAAAEKVN